MTSREEFEAVFSSSPYEFSLDRYGENTAWPDSYKKYHVECAWDGWKEGASSRDKEIALLKTRVRMYKQALFNNDGTVPIGNVYVFIEDVTDAQVLEWAERNPE